MNDTIETPVDPMLLTVVEPTVPEAATPSSSEPVTESIDIEPVPSLDELLKTVPTEENHNVPEGEGKMWAGFPEDNLRFYHKTVVYPTLTLGNWNWDKKLGLRTRILQVVSYVLKHDAILFTNHKPLTGAKKEGFTQVNVILDFVQELDNGIDA